jgi:TPR repeat protein
MYPECTHHRPDPAVASALTACLVLAALAAIAVAGPLEDAESAHARGDDATALRLLLPLAEDGNASAQFALGFIYDTTKGTSRDDAEAAKWYRKAADQGVAGAQYNLGAMYADGHGVPQDYVEAYKWLTLAASRFPPSEKESRDVAVKSRDLAATKMTSAQIEEAQKLVHEWMSK